MNDNTLAGPVPSEFGRLAALRELLLTANADMSGALPVDLTNLQLLEVLHVGRTGLCAPSDARFQGWLRDVPNQRVGACDTESTMAYLTQATQSREFPVELVSGRDALLRVFVTAARANNEPFPPVRATFYLDGAVAHVAEIGGKAGPIPTEADEGSLAKSVNARVSKELIRPGLEMEVEVDPGGTLDAGLGVRRQTGRITVDVSEMPVLDLTLIPFLQAGAADSTLIETVSDIVAAPGDHELLWQIRTLLPVGELRLAAHAPVVTTTYSADDLLRKTDAIRSMEGGTGYYMGLMARGDDTPEIGSILGLSAGPSMVSIPDARIMAHELGHSLSLLHPPGEAPPVDVTYPHGDGATGSWGYDSRDGGRLVSPDTYDLMSYGTPGWIGDYHYGKALRFRRTVERQAAPPAHAPRPSLLLWGGIDAEGELYLDPAFVVEGSPKLPRSAGEYRLVGRSEEGRELFDVGFAMSIPADGGGRATSSFSFP